MTSSTRKLKFEGLPSVIGKSKLELLKAIYKFFSTQQNQDDWSLEDVIFGEDNSDAVVIFKELEAVEKIIKRGDTVTMFDTAVKVIPLYEEIDNKQSLTKSTKTFTTHAAADLHTSKNKQVDGMVRSVEKKIDEHSKIENCNNKIVKRESETTILKNGIETTILKNDTESAVTEEALINRLKAKGVLNVYLSFFGIQEFLQCTDGKQMIKEVEDKNGCMIKPELKAGNSCPSRWDFGNIKLSLIEDEINKQKTDIIVNSVSSSLDLESGKLTAVILKEAGYQIQTELKKRYSKGISSGEFAVSSGGNMQYKSIFHACLWTYTKDNVIEMKKLVKKLLEGAEKIKAESISFPALGTGNLNFPPEVSAQVILETIADYAQNNLCSPLRLVNIVLFPQDQIVSKAFKSVLIAGALRSSDDLPDICDDIDEVHNFGNVCFKIKQGDLTKERTDVIVSGIRDSMDLCNSGNVCRAFLRTCGQELQYQCNTKKTEMAQKGFVVISAPKLPCNNIIFLSQGKFSNFWNEGILIALMEAEKAGATSLALPALGAEAHVTDLMNVKKLIFQAVEQFSKLGQQKLNEINLVIFDSEILHHFLVEPHKTVISVEKRILSKSIWPSSISQDVNIKIYSHDEAFRNKAANQLKEKFLLAYKKNSINFEVSLQELDANEIQKLIDFGYQLSIKLTFNTEQNSVNMEGFQSDSILQLQTKVMEALMNIFFEWRYKKRKIWHSFGPVISKELEKKHKAVSFVEYIDAKGKRYKIDFHHMKMIPLDKKRKRSKDVERIKKNKSEQFQILCSVFTAKSFQLPSNWDAMSDTENLKIVEIIKGSTEYIEVELQLKSLFSSIKKIERIQNKSLYQQYFVKKEELDLHNPSGHQNEKKLFHGTAPKSIKQINENGFNRSYCGVNGTTYGKGVYFAAAPEYSSNYSKPDGQGNRHMYRARVLTGEFIATNEDTNYLPNKPGTHRPYDSGGDLNKGIFVLFHDSQAYPEYLITF